MKIEVVDSNSPDFPASTEHDFADFIVWLRLKMLPTHFVFTCYNKYWRAEDGMVISDEERYNAPEFALYRERLGVAEDTETKAKVLNCIAAYEEPHYRQIAKILSVANSCVGYHVADLKARGLIETDPLTLTELGEMAIDILNT
jgi:hypothetical protein